MTHWPLTHSDTALDRLQPCEQAAGALVGPLLPSGCSTLLLAPMLGYSGSCIVCVLVTSPVMGSVVALVTTDWPAVAFPALAGLLLLMMTAGSCTIWMLLLSTVVVLKTSAKTCVMTDCDTSVADRLTPVIQPVSLPTGGPVD